MYYGTKVLKGVYKRNRKRSDIFSLRSQNATKIKKYF